MRKQFLTTLALVALICGIESCSMDTDNEAEASVSYIGMCDKIVFADSGDVAYVKYITSAISTERLPLVGEHSLFTEKAKTDDGYVQNAVAKCNQQAIDTYDHVLANVSSSYLRSTLITLYGDSVDFDTLDAFTIHYSLNSFVSNSTVFVASYVKTYNK